MLEVDALLILLVGGLVAICVWAFLAPGARGGGGGRDRPRFAGAPPGLRSARQITEDREALDAEDLDQMLAAHNAWQRRRGRPERTLDDVERLVAADARARTTELAERELDELLAATNARRRAKGLPERSREDVRREFRPG